MGKTIFFLGGGYTIENPDKLIELDFVIITTVVYQYTEEIVSQLISFGIKREEIKLCRL